MGQALEERGMGTGVGELTRAGGPEGRECVNRARGLAPERGEAYLGIRGPENKGGETQSMGRGRQRSVAQERQVPRGLRLEPRRGRCQ